MLSKLDRGMLVFAALISAHTAYSVSVRTVLRQAVQRLEERTGLQIQYARSSLGMPGRIALDHISVDAQTCRADLRQFETSFDLFNPEHLSDLSLDGLSMECAPDAPLTRLGEDAGLKLVVPDFQFSAEQLWLGRELELSDARLSLVDYEMNTRIHAQLNREHGHWSEASSATAELPTLRLADAIGNFILPHGAYISAIVGQSVEHSEAPQIEISASFPKLTYQREAQFFDFDQVSLAGRLTERSAGASLDYPKKAPIDSAGRFAGSLTFRGDDAGVILTLANAQGLPEWVSTKFQGEAFKLKADISWQDDQLRLSNIELVRGAILMRGWLAFSSSLPKGALRFDYGGLYAAIHVDPAGQELLIAPSQSWLLRHDLQY